MDLTSGRVNISITLGGVCDVMQPERCHPTQCNEQSAAHDPITSAPGVSAESPSRTNAWLLTAATFLEDFSQSINGFCRPRYPHCCEVVPTFVLGMREEVGASLRIYLSVIGAQPYSFTSAK